MNLPEYEKYFNKYISQIENLLLMLDEEDLTKEKISKIKNGFASLKNEVFEDVKAIPVPTGSGRYTRIPLRDALNDIVYVLLKSNIHVSKNPVSDDWAGKLGHLMMSMIKNHRRNHAVRSYL